ncbi:IclR family transcriptional regulator [Pedobacter hiemivivus]|uniref:IclR family transcriptional regulator n=1 Tax=Pedobacter hiemivivus TaxID=2530454 RepID=A0A4U1GPT6_9SPHI|nr:IclR family transcriptional regulator C-terminal domain-containing protein [Pedobacter hiemivivus]TKC65150.1 IclR family transcriptional regulator [Pedobacter hiemivivus]
MIQVINRALDVLEYISIEPDQPKPLSVIASHFNLNAGTCANIIKTLVTRKYIEKVEKKGYCLGSQAYVLTGNEGYHKDLVKAAQKEMEALTSIYDENSLLSILVKDVRVAIVRVTGTNNIQVVTSKEKRVYDTASGRLLIAMLPEAELTVFITKYGLPKKEEWAEVKNEKSLRESLSLIKAQGYAKQVTAGNIVGFAVPVYSGERVLASLCLYMPEYRFHLAEEQKIVDDLLTTAEKIKKNLVGK